jgi:hypothetical protein
MRLDHPRYMTFALDGTYREYARQERHPNGEPSFMTMHEFGPWNMERKEDIKHRNRFLLAFTLHADDSATQTEAVEAGQLKK